MTSTVFDARTQAARASVANGKTLELGAGAATYELYHFALSLCSQKVRATLAEAEVPYRAHDINSDPGNYHADYIRLRLLGVGSRGFATRYSGRSAVETEGVDPLVVPTLVDLTEKRVVIDSRAICLHLARSAAPELVPAGLESAIEQELDIVDATPHVAMLYGAHPDRDFRPERIRGVMPGMHDRRLVKLERLMSENKADPQVTAAFAAKIEKEEAGRIFVHTPDAMRAAVDEMTQIVAGLASRLDDGRRWVCGEDFTLADVIWAVSLFRMQWIGMAFLWDGGDPLNPDPHPLVRAYGQRLFERAPFRQAVIDWPDVPRSEYVAEYYDS